MKGNDISNGIPQRVLVHLDVVTVKVTEDVPVMKLFKNITRKVEHEFFDTVVISNLWRFSENYSVMMDLFATEGTQKELDAKLEHLDTHQAHPFRSAILYPSLRALVSTLPYRQDLMGVIDIPERGLRYGSRWIDLNGGF